MDSIKPNSYSPLEIFVFVLCLGAVFCLATFDINEHDYWWHLQTGRYIIEHKSVPRQDVFSYTATEPWIAHYWLADVILYLFYGLIGTPGLILCNAAMVTVTFYILITAAFGRGGPPELALLLGYLAAVASRHRFYVRPETYSLLFLAIYIFLYTRLKYQGSFYPLIAFPVLQLLWFNLYGGGAVTGLIILCVLLAGEALNSISERLFPRARTGCSMPDRRLKAFAVSILLSAGFSFINPNGYRTVTYFLLSRNEIFRHIVEWKRTTSADLLGLPGFFMVCGLFSFRAAGRKTNMADVTLFSVFTLLALNAWRTIPFMAMVSVPVISANAGGMLRKTPSTARMKKVVLLAVASGIAIYTPWLMFKDIGHFQRDYAFGIGVNRKLIPKQACDFIERHNIRGNMFNSYGIGGYLIWRFWPERRVFVDGRVEMYGIPFLAEYMLYWRPDVWERYESDYNINYAMIDREPNYTTRHLDEREDWRLVFFDDRAMIYLKDTPENMDVIKRYGYEYIRPASLDFSYFIPLLLERGTAEKVIEELKRSLHEDETYNLNAHLMLGYCFTQLGIRHYQRAIEHYQKALNLMPESGDIKMKIMNLKRALGAA